MWSSWWFVLILTQWRRSSQTSHRSQVAVWVTGWGRSPDCWCGLLGTNWTCQKKDGEILSRRCAVWRAWRISRHQRQAPAQFSHLYSKGLLTTLSLYSKGLLIWLIVSRLSKGFQYRKNNTWWNRIKDEILTNKYLWIFLRNIHRW